MKIRRLIFLTLFLTGISSLTAQPRYTDATLPLEQRIKILSEQLTLEEKIDLLCAKAPAIQRLGIPEYDWWSEGLHGVARAGKATVFPKPIGMGSIWDAKLIERIGEAVSDEARAKYHAALRNKGYSERYEGLTYFSPTLNIARDPRWGRTSECFSEDTYLTAKTGAAYIKGLQGNDPRYLKLAATSKHFVANNEENRRNNGSATVDEISLREYYFPAFRESIENGKAASVMGAYNALNGVPCCANKFLLTDVLRTEWNFDGVVISDGSAIGRISSDHKYCSSFEEGAALALKAGCDMALRDEYRQGLRDAYKKGYIALEDIDRAIYRVLKLRFRLGMFDLPENVPYSRIPESVIESAEHRELALEAARKSIILLKNDRLLPLDPKKKIRLALIGQAFVQNYYGDYSGVPEHNLTLREAIRQLAGENGQIQWLSDAVEKQVIPSTQLVRDSKYEYDGRLGLTAAYYGTADCTGSPLLERHELTLDLSPMKDNTLKTENIQSATWNTSLSPNLTGEYTIYYTGAGDTRIVLGGQTVLDKNVNGTESFKVNLEEGKLYPLQIRSGNIRKNDTYRLSWSLPLQKDALTPETLAAQSDVAVVFVRDDGASEGRDRSTLAVSPEQQKLIERVAKANPNTVVVMGSSTPLMIKELVGQSKAFLNVWIAGQGESQAIAEILFGKTNPSGKTPVTFFEREELLPPLDDYNVKNGRSYQYATDNVLFPFGYGLSYTHFNYRALKLDKSRLKTGQTAFLTIDISNDGEFDGEEVIQCYADNPDWKASGLQKKLIAFDRVFLKKGERKKLKLAVDTSGLSRWNTTKQRWEVSPGNYTIQAGGNSVSASKTSVSFTIQ
ncbi:glycoside hydrolase family 3 protein [Viscerimonas tarda]